MGASWMLSTRMINDPEAVGILTDSAIKPMVSISGITRARALAAPVEVRMMLFMTLRFFLRSVAPLFGQAVKDLLGAGGRMDGGHGCGQNPVCAKVVKQWFDHVGKAVGGARGVGDQGVNPWIIAFVVDPP